MAQQQWNQTPGGVTFGYPDAKSTEIERTRHIPDSLTYLEKSIARAAEHASNWGSDGRYYPGAGGMC